MSYSDSLLEISGLCTDPERTNQYTSRFGLTTPTYADVAAGRQIAADLIHPEISSADIFWSVQSVTQCALHMFVEDGRLTGMLSFFGLNEAGFSALKKGKFDAVTPNLDYICRPHEVPLAVYGWGIAATTRPAAKAVMSATAGVCADLYWALPIFARVATQKGRRAMIDALGFQFMPNDPTQMVWRPALNSPPQRSAA